MSGYLDLPGTAGVDASTPDAAALDITDKLSVEVDVALLWDTDFTTDQVLAGKWAASPNRGWYLSYGLSGGKLSLVTSPTGSNSAVSDSINLSALVVDDERVVVKVVKSGTAVNFFVNGSAHGSEVTHSSATINTNAADLIVGGMTSQLWVCDGKFFGCKVWDDTTLVYDADFTDLTAGELAADAFVEDSAQAATVTLNGAYTYTNITAAVSGTAVAGGVGEAEIVAGGETIILTLTNDTWHADMGTDDASTTALIAGLDSGGSEGAGWDAVVKANMTFADVARTSNTVVTITLGAESTYQITADETVTVTVPAAALAIGVPVVGAPTFDVTAYVPPSEGSYAGYGSVGALRARITADGNTPNGFEPPALVAQIVGSTIQSEVLGHLTGFAGATERGTLGALLEVIAADGGTITDVGDVESALVRFAEVYEP